MQGRPGHWSNGAAWPRLAAVALLVVAAACASPRVDPWSGFASDEIAILTADRPQELYLTGRGALTITRINDTAVSGERRDSVAYQLRPGRHRIAFRYDHSALCLGDLCLERSHARAYA